MAAKLRTLIVLALLVTFAASAEAKIVTYSYTGEVKSLHNYEGENLIPVDVGAEVFALFTLDLSKTNASKDTSTVLTFREMVVGFELEVGGFSFAPTDNPFSHGLATMRNDLVVDIGPYDYLGIASPELGGDGVNIYRAGITVVDRSAELFSHLSVDNLLDLQLSDYQLLGAIELGRTGSSPFLHLGEVTLSPAFIPGDANTDGSVNALDLNILALNWQQNASWSSGDFTSDGIVNAADLNELAINWQSLQDAPVPEPSGLTLFLIATSLIAIQLRRRNVR